MLLRFLYLKFRSGGISMLPSFFPLSLANPLPMSTRLLTIPLYAKEIKSKKIMNRHSVFKAVQKNKLHLLPGVISIKKVGTYYLLEMAI